MKYEYSCILRLLTQLTAYMLSHTLKSLAIDDAMYASESYWELCVVRYRYSKVLFGKPIFQSKYMAKIQNLKKMFDYVHSFLICNHSNKKRIP